MKKMTKRIAAAAALIFAVGCLCLPGSQASAASKTAVKSLAKGKTYNLDLNGGKKEKIRWTESENGKLTIKVNGKAVMTKKLDPDCDWCEIKYLDWNTKDKYKELLVVISGDDAYLEDMRILRYDKAGKTKVFKYKKSAWSGILDCIVDDKFSNSGKNKVSMVIDTPYYCPTFGYYYAKVSASIKKDYFYIRTQNSYKTVDSKSYMEDYEKNGHYTLARSMKLYDSAKRAKVLSTLKSGTKFDPVSVKPMKMGYNHDHYKIYDLLVKVKTTTGKTGWLYFPKEDNGNRYLDYVPGWA